MKTKQSATRRALALFMSMLMLLTAWVFVAPTASAEGEAAYLLELPEAGGTLEDGKVYAVNEDKTINGGANQNGLVVANGATVVIYIASSATLTVTGGAGSNASGTTAATGGKAAIYVPADATLILTGAGTLNATGGQGGNAANGGNGANARCDAGGDWLWCGGQGGYGGAGAGGGGAAIGGNGGNGGSGVTAPYMSAVYEADDSWNYGMTGTAGNKGGDGTASGTVYVTEGVTVNAQGGDTGSNGSGGNKGSIANYKQKRYWNAIGGAGGGGGGKGSAGAAVGGGGYGGGSGGSGATGCRYWCNNEYGSCHAYGGGGGNDSGGAGTNCMHPWSRNDGNTGGGGGGAHGNAGSNGAYETGLAKTDTKVSAALTKTYTLDKQQGEGGDGSVTATIGEAFPAITVPTRTGYTLNGYFTDTNGAGVKAYHADGTSARTADLNPTELYAGWTQNEPMLSVNVNGDGGTFDLAIDGETVSSNATSFSEKHLSLAQYAITANPATGYHFVSATEALIGTLIDDDVYVGLTFAINTYDVTFTSSGKGYTVTTAPDATVNHGDSVSFAIELGEGYSNSAVPAVTATSGTVSSSQSGSTITYTVSNITDNTEITVGDATINTYTITWKNWDDTVLTTSEVAYGETPEYTGTTPTRQATAQYTYTFHGWDPMIAAVSGDAVYTAQFNFTVNKYSVTFKDQNGDIIGTPQEVEYGSNATAPDDLDDYSDETNHYTFDGWSGYTNIQEDTVIQATFTSGAHVFDQQNTDAKYLKSGATCTAKAVYYYSCSCGYKGTETFDSGEKLEHSFTNYVSNNDATCTKDGTETASCDYGCGETDTRTAEGSKLSHSFTELKHDATDHWYKCANCDATTEKEAHKGGTATCTEKAICEVCDTAYGDLLDHDYSVLQHDATDHWYKCANCDATTEKEAHKGGTATCTEQASCSVCDTAYGDLLEHSFTELKHDATDHWYKCANCDATTEKEAHKGGTATCTEKAICEVCDTAYGDLLDHDYSVLQHDATDHWYKCANCDATTEKEAHKGGTATCTEKATCEVCDTAYGDLLDHDYSVLQHDASDHWYKCANCDATTEKEAHKGGTATCTEKAICEVCDTAYGDLLDHDFSELKSDADGHWYKCANCDATTEKEAHKGGTATCTEQASCSVCDTAYGNFDYTNHSTDATVKKNEKAAGYTTKGYTGDIYCAACDHLKENGSEIDKLNLADNETVKSANEILAAEEAAPGTYDAEKIAALQQALTDLETLANGTDENAVLEKITAIGEMLETIAPEAYVTVTFTVDGETVSTQTIKVGTDATAPEQAAYINDGDSHKAFSGWTGDYTNVTADVTVTATYTTQDHTWTDGDVTKAATCMATGTQMQTCVCGATHEKTLDKDPANHTGNTTVTRENEVPATCTAAGSYDEVVTCECGAQLSREAKTIAQKQHSFTSYVFDNNASCTKDGTETAACDFGCGTTDTRVKAGSALGHEWGEWVVLKEATCTETGSKTRTCTRDDAHTETVTTPMLDHNDANGDTLCDDCGAPMPNHQHTDDDHDNVCDTCHRTIDTGFRCSWCNKNDRVQAGSDPEIYKLVYRIIHFFVHMVQSIKFFAHK